MTSERIPEPDPRKKRALVIGGIIAVAAIGWNIEEWGDNDPPVIISIDGDRDEARDVVRSALRDEIRASFRGDEESDDEEAAGDEASDEADSEETDEVADVETVTEDVGVGERRLVETESDDNQRSFRIEGDDGRGVTISVDADPAE